MFRKGKNDFLYVSESNKFVLKKNLSQLHFIDRRQIPDQDIYFLFVESSYDRKTMRRKFETACDLGMYQFLIVFIVSAVRGKCS